MDDIRFNVTSYLLQSPQVKVTRLNTATRLIIKAINILNECLRILIDCVVLQNLLQHVFRFFHPRSSCTTHISADVQRIKLNASCMTISGGRTEQLDIFCRVTGFTSDFLSFIDVELIRFFHGDIQLLYPVRRPTKIFTSCRGNLTA